VKSFSVFCLIFCLLIPAKGWCADPQATTTFTLQEAVEYALAHYPSVRAALAQYNAAKAGVGLARTNYLPSVNSVWQGDRGTRNSVLGVLLPQSPTILTGTQGTVLPDSDQAYWVSGMGVLLSWEPFTFGYRGAQVRAAQATQNRTEAQIALTKLGVASAVANASLAVLAAEQTVKASQADVNRRVVFDRSIHTLVDAHLRPGADASRADAELAVARTKLIQAERSQHIAAAGLAELLGIAGGSVEIREGPFLRTPPESAGVNPSLTSHPAAVAGQRAVEESEANLNVLNHAFYPHLTLQGLASGRGSNEVANRPPAAALNGFNPTARNWEAGLNVQMDLTSFFSIRQRRKVAAFDRQRQEAQYAVTIQTLTGQEQEAVISVRDARRVAQNTPVELAAAQQSEAQALARFQAGVGHIVDVAEAQSLLVQAQIDDSLARLSIWRALAQLAAAQGDLAPFLGLANQTPSH
jgi:outer membrane protein TolC